ncbi:bifunctional phosphoribosylaminoimidazolecarboxamide formyltransferase/inosine monophosphate cyclohydrolase [Azospirillum baldaniorum]|uniref:Bifunctional purine biosynthesis protein PurH n=1 Tax=Azospirillum baldaniorum TaxID=1064539 RepID=A0A9P1JMI5_9PROT|nr:bifunctional phosphoribosylaminoimidazolecarboxamide formyltransferase/IMP cyclohydrolase [Azospirillum baldaniorum]AWJ88760.1 bifunctional phosphoribosylaminoimidazolecarboxamide formyltransferase/inosine monophosphate cyclohydrolase [Azospirillum baldaniorum]NUB06538.1 bifunctional phosphoribosylaminoimidazolecarboxamide formyltransferase/IMP cyclohydrolase [Azospirillum baldaniorum]TWA79699.1 phosphoribosylaminoimidazolecarboxamide formyltransferase/IMP cyclohydrolase [Azospirillum brasile
MSPPNVAHSPAPDLVRITRALISVSDKTGLVALGQALAAKGVEILSTGGSAQRLAEAGIPVKEVSDHTGFPEIMDGRVKTLHPRVHGGILARRDIHAEAMTTHDIPPIDLVVVNLYPFEATVSKGADYANCVENIDIGGPAMIRAAAKNHDFVTVVTDPEDYEAVLDELATHDGAVTLTLRRTLAQRAYARTASYDAAISSWLAGQLGETFPPRTTLSGKLSQTLRYGENPHQQAAFYVTGEQRPGVATAIQLQGKELSYNNLNDTDAAFELVAEFERPAVAIIKHANPCGVAEGANLLDAYKQALLCDPVSAFGGIIAVNRPLDAATAEEIAKLFAEVVIAPDADDAARALLATKKNLRVLLTKDVPNPAEPGMMVKQLSGGFLLQNRDNGRITLDDLKVVTKRAPTEQELADLLFAFRVAKHVKSNAIVYAKNGATVGVGAGQMSRVDSARIAAIKSAEAAKAAGLSEPLTKGSVVASDAFFPFADGLLAAAEAGVTAVIQPGGSIRDNDVIAAADEKGLAMVLTGMRHFRH